MNRLYEEVRNEVERTAHTIAEYQDDRKNWLSQFEDAQRRRNECQTEMLVKCQQYLQIEKQLTSCRETAESTAVERDDLKQQLAGRVNLLENPIPNVQESLLFLNRFSSSYFLYYYSCRIKDGVGATR